MIFMLFFFFLPTYRPKFWATLIRETRNLIGVALSISDQSLDAVVRDIILQFPSSGEVMIRGHLQSRKVGAQSTLAKCLMT